VANRTAIGPWETFTLEAPGVSIGAEIGDGTGIRLKTSAGWYLSAPNGGGGELLANKHQGSDWETLYVEKLAACDPIPNTHFEFSIENIRVTNTRSRDDDTDYLTLSVAENGQAPVSRVEKIGDHIDNGEYQLQGWTSGVKDCTNGVVVHYAVDNRGYRQSEFEKLARKAADSFVAAAVTWLTGGSSANQDTQARSLGNLSGDWAKKQAASWKEWLAKEAANVAMSLLFPNCDGPCVAETLALDLATLQSYCVTPACDAGPFEQERFYPGIESAHGCGDNSEYYVTLKITPH
jgi:hypothetical protein